MKTLKGIVAYTNHIHTAQTTDHMFKMLNAPGETVVGNTWQDDRRRILSSAIQKQDLNCEYTLIEQSHMSSLATI